MNRYRQQSLEHIFKNNKKWVLSKKGADPAFFDKLAAGQSPDYL
jgi:carbonic anhydrase